MSMLTYPIGLRGLNFGLNLYLHLYFVYACSVGCGESAHLRKLAGAFIAKKMRHVPKFNVLSHIIAI